MRPPNFRVVETLQFWSKTMPDHIVNDSHHELSILRLPDVMKRTGLSRSTIYGAVQAQAFPRQVRLTARCVGWLERDVNAWLLTKKQPA